MKRIYHNHNLREDWKQGLYDSACENVDQKIEACKHVLSTQTIFEQLANEVIKRWPYSCEHNLTDSGRNRQAYLGQVTCCFYCGAPEYITKIAWNLLNKSTQDKANKTADLVINKYIKQLENKLQLQLL